MSFFKISKINLSVLLNVVFLIIIGILLNRMSQWTLILDSNVIPPVTYVAIHDLEVYDTSSPYNYYLFVDDNEAGTIEITDFDRNIILAGEYRAIGNGVFKISEDQGFIVRDRDRDRDTLSLILTEENELIQYTEYTQLVDH